MRRACCKLQEKLTTTLGHLGTMKQWTFVGALLHQFVSGKDLMHFFRALTSSRAGRCLPNLSASLHDLVFRLIFSNCLLAKPALNNPHINVLSPRGQCASIRSRVGPRLVDAWLPKGRRENLMVEWDGPVIRVKVPRWVGNSIYPRAAWRGKCIAPRFVEKERELNTPAELKGVTNRYAQSGHGPRCVVPASFPATVAGVLAAIEQAETFCSQLSYYFRWLS